MKIREMNVLEGEFLDLIGWRLYVSPKEFAQYMDSVLLATAARGEGEQQDSAETDAPPEREDA